MVTLCAKTTPWRATASHGPPECNAHHGGGAGSHDDLEHGSAAPVDPWCPTGHSRDRWRKRSTHHAGHWLSPYWNREDLRSQVLSAGCAADRSYRLSLSAHE